MTAMLFALLPLAASARPARPGIVPVRNSDGSVTEVRIYGDARFSYMTSPDSAMLMVRGKDGIVRPAVGSDGCPLAPDSLTLYRYARRGLKAPARAAKYDERGRSYFNTLGHGLHSLVVLVEFPDRKFSMDDAQAYYSRMLNERGFADNGARGCAAEYFEECSGGRFSPVFDVTRVVTLPFPSFMYSGKPYDVKFAGIIKYAVSELTGEVDFARYDTDDDGVVDNIHFIYSGFGAADGGSATCIWPHSSEYDGELTADGKKISPYSCTNELRNDGTKNGVPDGIGGFCHEYAHVLGLPVLSRSLNNTDNHTPGDFSLMDSGSYNGDGNCPPAFSAYEKWVCRWLEYEELEIPGHVDLRPGKGLRMSLYNADGLYPDEYFIVETRAATGWDECLPQHGLLFWHINYVEMFWENNTVNSYGISHVTTVQCDAGHGVTAWPGIYEYSWIAPVPMSLLVPENTPKSMFTPVLTDIVYDGKTGAGSFDYALDGEYPDLTTTMPLPARLGDDTRDLRFEWEPLAPGTQYILSVWREGRTFQKLYLDGCDCYRTADTECRLYGISDMDWNMRWTADLYAVDVLPSATPSARVEFVPAECEPWAGVDDVRPDTPSICGGNGTITAPEDALVYTMQGVPAGRDRLAPGVYIVRCRGSVTKVLVK